MNLSQHVYDKYIKDKKMTSETYIEGIGTVREYGELNVEELVKTLLKSKYITG